MCSRPARSPSGAACLSTSGSRPCSGLCSPTDSAGLRWGTTIARTARMQPASSAAHTALPRALWLWTAAVALGALYISSTIVTPLYHLYEQRFDFSELVVTEIYASYLIGNLTVLFFFGRLSDQ